MVHALHLVSPAAAAAATAAPGVIWRLRLQLCRCPSALLVILLLLLHDWPASEAAGGFKRVFDVEERIATHWRELETICPDRNYTSCKGVDRSKWTDASRTQLSELSFNGLGAWSTFTMQTFDFGGTQRTRGGDAWFVFLRDMHAKVKVPCRVFDEGNGAYTVACMFMQPGNFSVWAWHWYSNCYGLMEPNIQFPHSLSIDSHYVKFLTPQDHCYVGGKLRRRFTRIEESTPLPACAAATCTEPAPPPPAAAGAPGRIWRMETYTYVKNFTFTHLNCCRPPRVPPPPVRTQRLLMYGDSTVANSWDILMHLARKLCNFKVTIKPRHLHEPFDRAYCPNASSLADVDPVLNEVMMRCTAGVPWTAVPIGVDERAVADGHKMAQVFDMNNFTYNDTYVKSHVPPIPMPIPHEFTVIFVNGGGSRPLMIATQWLKNIRAGDVAVISMGAHYSRTHTFAQWKEHIDGFAPAAKEAIARTGATIVFRSSFMWKEHIFRSNKDADPMLSWHFNTDIRRLMFDSYAEHVLVPAGVHWWDVFGTCAMGEYKPRDVIHVDLAATLAQNMDMMDLFACHGKAGA